jgi:hypothetical protein
MAKVPAKLKLKLEHPLPQVSGPVVPVTDQQMLRLIRGLLLAHPLVAVQLGVTAEALV